MNQNKTQVLEYESAIHSTEFGGFVGAIVEKDHNPACEKYLAHVLGDTREEVRELQKRIVTAVNTHDELIASLRDLLRTSEHIETNAKSNALNRALNILRQVEQKYDATIIKAP